MHARNNYEVKLEPSQIAANIFEKMIAFNSGYARFFKKKPNFELQLALLLAKMSIDQINDFAEYFLQRPAQAWHNPEKPQTFHPPTVAALLFAVTGIATLQQYLNKQLQSPAIPIILFLLDIPCLYFSQQDMYKLLTLTRGFKLINIARHLKTIGFAHNAQTICSLAKHLDNTSLISLQQWNSTQVQAVLDTISQQSHSPSPSRK